LSAFGQEKVRSAALSDRWQHAENRKQTRKPTEPLDAQAICDIETLRFKEHRVVKTKKRKQIRKLYNAADIKLLKQHSKSRTAVAKIAKLMKRSEGSLRQKALKLGIGLGHQR
jgi:hypothetical protein